MNEENHLKEYLCLEQKLREERAKKKLIPVKVLFNKDTFNNDQRRRREHNDPRCMFKTIGILFKKYF